ncbi:PAS domain-containing protein [Emticicia sp. 21SJ11W-3]|uniref:PAS domain-containing sensor histidine kinase n=1 Tax=Emticicia sp. 21SJ11W-3 TaxID=2916755 RepID=UPI0020A06EDD|nr:PAS domain-containing protein [Emticicia sp. 21SJ11W-3]UTA66853.1 PAS domain-containing protein [Emticicia sp. 21SJ11W-3]
MTTSDKALNDYPFLNGGGEMGDLMRKKDWSQTAIGIPANWPVQLKQMVATMLNVQSPMLICWGDSFTQLYNDAFITLLGARRHPNALGSSTSEIYTEAWESFMAPLFSRVQGGEPVSFKDFKRVINRNGFDEEVYLDFSYSAIKDENCQTQGILVICNETSDKVASIRKLSESESRFRALIEEAPIATSLYVGRELIIEVANEKMLNLWGKDAFVIGKPLAYALPELEGQPFLDILDNIFDTGLPYEAKAMTADLEVNGVLSSYIFDFTYKPLFNADGQVYAIINMAIDVTAQTLAQQKIAESQRELLSSFEESPVGIAIISKENLTFRNVNAFYATLVGRGKTELINKPLLEALPEMKGQGFDQLLNNVIETGQSYNAKEARVEIFRNGKLETIYVDLTYQPRAEGENEIVGVLVVANDITEQVVTRKRIEENETKLSTIISSAPASIGLYVGKDLIIENPNQTFIELMGKGPAIEGKPLKEVMPELITENQPFLQILEEVMITGKAYHSFGSLAKIVKNGVMTSSYYNITYTPVFNADKETSAILEIAVDVTEQIKAQQALEEAEAELRGAVELAGLATWKLDIKNMEYTFSPLFKEWTGLSLNSGDIEKVNECIPEPYRTQMQNLNTKATEPGGTGTYEYEHPIINLQTGQKRIIRAQGQVFYDSAGEAAFMSGSAQDITMQRQMQLALENQVKERTKELDEAIEKLQLIVEELAESNTKLTHSNAELAQFAYIASHDLQEPLRKITIFSQLLEKSLGENLPAESSNFLTKIKNSANRMTALIRDVLMYSQLAKENQNFERVDLNVILEHILTDYDLLIEQKQAVIRKQPMPVIKAIPLQMTQLFANLTGNALKFVKAGVQPVIDISASVLTKEEIIACGLSTDYGYYSIRFADNGIGIPAEYAEKVFHIFQRLHRKSDYEGTGIGLAMCKKIAQNHNGDIVVENNSNGGATFNVILPAYA